MNISISSYDLIDITDQCLFLSPQLLTPWCCGAATNYDELVIKNESEFLHFKDEICNCPDNKTSTIDFTNYNLLVKWSKGLPCSNDYRRTVHIDVSNKKLFFTYKELYDSDTSKNSFDLYGNFILIPVKYEAYTIEYQLDKSTRIPSLQSKELDSLRLTSSKVKQKVDSLTQLLNDVNMKIKDNESYLLDSFYNTVYIEYKDSIEKGNYSYINNNSANIYKDHNSNSKVLFVIPPHSQIIALRKYGEYIYVKYRKYRGWVLNDYILSRCRGIETLQGEEPVIIKELEYSKPAYNNKG